MQVKPRLNFCKPTVERRNATNKKKQRPTAGLNYARATWFLFCCAFYLH